MRRKVYISSTYADLHDIRDRILNLFTAPAIDTRLQLCTVMERMFSDGTERTNVTVCEDEVMSSDVYIIIVGARYGSTVPDKDYTYTGREYQLAKASGSKKIYRLISTQTYVDAKELELSASERNNRDKFNEFKKEVKGSYPVTTFDDDNDLYQKLVNCIYREAFPDQKFTVKQLVDIDRNEQTVRYKTDQDRFGSEVPRVMPLIIMGYDLDMPESFICRLKLNDQPDLNIVVDKGTSADVETLSGSDTKNNTGEILAQSTTHLLGQTTRNCTFERLPNILQQKPFGNRFLLYRISYSNIHFDQVSKTNKGPALSLLGKFIVELNQALSRCDFFYHTVYVAIQVIFDPEQHAQVDKVQALADVKSFLNIDPIFSIDIGMLPQIKNEDILTWIEKIKEKEDERDNLYKSFFSPTQFPEYYKNCYDLLNKYL